MDDSFLQIVLLNEIRISEINLGVVMAQINLGEKIEIVGAKCLRRISFLAIRMRGLFILKF
jgi:hypothetical protein